MKAMQLITKFFKPKPTINLEQEMKEVTETETTQPVVTQPVITETAAEEVARLHFKERSNLGQAIIIQKSADKKTADVWVIDRNLGTRIHVRLPVNEFLEAGCDDLARRFSSGAVTETLYC